MRLPLTITFAGMLALTMAGCGAGEEDNSAAVQPQTTPQAAPKPFEKPPIVAQNLEKIPIPAAPGLIQPTNPNQRAQQVQKGRKDPFAGLFAPIIPRGATAAATPQSTQLPKLPVAEAPQPVAVKPSPQPSPVPAIPLPPVAPETAFVPPPPQPEIARGVSVMGVVQIGNEVQAIVQVPNEATSRYIAVGQWLSNGQVLVKRIEVNQGSDPLVILEQNGIEVAKAVGEEPASPDNTNTPTSVPAPPSPDNTNTPTTTPAPLPPTKTNLPPDAAPPISPSPPYTEESDEER